MEEELFDINFDLDPNDPESDGLLDLRGDETLGVESDFDVNAVDRPSEQVIKEELSETLKAFIAKRTADKARWLQNTDSEYWCCLVFDDRGQKEEFLKKMNWIQYGDKYLDGVLLAIEQQIELPEAFEVYVPPPDKKLILLTEPLEGEENA